MAISRTKLQDKALSGIYSLLIYRSIDEEVDIKALVSHLEGKDYEECDVYLKKTIIECVKHFSEIVPIIEKNLRNWTFERLDMVEQAILILAYVHYVYVEPEIDKAIVIDIAIKQAKEYLDDDKDYKFVNAILNNILLPHGV